MQRIPQLFPIASPGLLQLRRKCVRKMSHFVACQENGSWPSIRHRIRKRGMFSIRRFANFEHFAEHNQPTSTAPTGQRSQ